jgi:N utilization substance protein B
MEQIYRRRMVREKVLQALYAYELSKEPIAEVMQNVLEEIRSNRYDFEFAKRLVTEVVQHETEVEQFIKGKVAHWEYDRIALIDRLLLRMGICELLYFPEIPPKVTINESIEVAKVFSTDESGRFINGVLDAIYEDLRTSKRLHKEGRGLVDTRTTPLPDSSQKDPQQPDDPQRKKPRSPRRNG